MQKDLEGILGASPEQGQLNPMTATPQGDENPEEVNPLETMDEISKQKPDGKKGNGNKKLDPDTIEEMLMTGENTGGMFEPDAEEPKDSEPKLNEEVDEDAKRKIKDNTAKPEEKYMKSFRNDMMKHPNDYTIMTSKGEMTIAEAIQKGYNPITKRFEKEHNQRDLKENMLSQLNDADRENVERLTNPSAAQVAPADAEKYGLDANSPMIRGQEQGMPQAANPMAAPQAPAVPPQGAVPAMGGTQAEQPQSAGLEAMLGGAM